MLIIRLLFFKIRGVVLVKNRFLELFLFEKDMFLAKTWLKSGGFR